MERAVQEKVVTYQLLQRYLEGLGEQIVLLENRLLEINATEQTLDDFVKVEKGNSVYVNLGSGCWTLSRVEKPKSILFNLGAGIFAEREIPSVKEALAERAKAIEEEIERIHRDMHIVKEKLTELAKDIGQAISP